MQFKLWNGGAKKTPTEPVRIRVRESSVDGAPIIVAVDEHGKDIRKLVKLTADGGVYRYAHVGKTLGFNLDTKGRIREATKSS